MTADEFSRYLRRLNLAEAPAADAAGLSALWLAHRRAIPFENLDVPLGRGVSLDPAALVAKLVDRRRGGYCFEQTGLFLAALAFLGFVARPLLGRVWLRHAAGDPVPARTHTLALVTIGDDSWIADPGFGGDDAPPMPLREGERTAPDGTIYRLAPDRLHGWMLWRGDRRQYSFTTDIAWPADIAQAHHEVATAPDSRFVRLRIATRTTDEGLISLVDDRLSHAGQDMHVPDAEAYRAILDEGFGIALAADEVARLGLYAPAGT